jgi:hypothetical protein
MHMLSWFTSFRISMSAVIASVPVIATVVTSFFSVVLARATLRYVEATDKGLALAREEFEREWSPELHIKLEKVSPTEARMVVTNLAKSSVLLQMAQLRKLTHAMPSERWFLNDPLVGGMTWTHDITRRLVGTTEGEFEGSVVASMTFYASGRMYRTDWFRFNIQMREGRIARLDPSNIPARRVRVIDRKSPEYKQELVQDVASDAAPAKNGDDNFFVARA